MIRERLNDYKVVLASASPRRKELLNKLGLEFEVSPINIDESYPTELRHQEIALYLSELKAKAFDTSKLCNNYLIITADTIVCLGDKVLNKPKNYDEAYEMLQLLSGNSHEVITGVSLRVKSKIRSFTAVTEVWFKKLTHDEIVFYINEYKPFDKAGAYGIQEWIGYIGIEKIEGSYFNVVGLPIQKLYSEIDAFLQ